MKKPGLQSPFGFIPKVFDGVEFKAAVKFYHTKLIQPCLYRLFALGHSHAAIEKYLPQTMHPISPSLEKKCICFEAKMQKIMSFRQNCFYICSCFRYSKYSFYADFQKIIVICSPCRQPDKFVLFFWLCPSYTHPGTFTCRMYFWVCVCVF